MCLPRYAANACALPRAVRSLAYLRARVHSRADHNRVRRLGPQARQDHRSRGVRGGKDQGLCAIARHDLCARGAADAEARPHHLQGARQGLQGEREARAGQARQALAQDQVHHLLSVVVAPCLVHVDGWLYLLVGEGAWFPDDSGIQVDVAVLLWLSVEREIGSSSMEYSLGSR